MGFTASVWILILLAGGDLSSFSPDSGGLKETHHKIVVEIDQFKYLGNSPAKGWMSSSGLKYFLIKWKKLTKHRIDLIWFDMKYLSLERINYQK